MSCNCYNRGCADSGGGWSSVFGMVIVCIILSFVFALGRAYERVEGEKPTVATAAKQDHGLIVRVK